MRHECRRAILLIAYRLHIYTTIHWGNWFPYPDPLERCFFSKDGHHWNHSETSTPKKNMNMQHNEHTHDTRSNSQWKKYEYGTMQICPITTRGNATWYWVLNNHEPCASVYSWLHGRSLCTYIYMYMYVQIIKYIAMRGEFPFKTLCRQFLFMWSGLGSIALYLSISSC